MTNAVQELRSKYILHSSPSRGFSPGVIRIPIPRAGIKIKRSPVGTSPPTITPWIHNSWLYFDVHTFYIYIYKHISVIAIEHNHATYSAVHISFKIYDIQTISLYDKFQRSFEERKWYKRHANTLVVKRKNRRGCCDNKSEKAGRWVKKKGIYFSFCI